MVPAIIELLDDRAWWPSSTVAATHALHEAAEAREDVPAGRV
jgi:uncharacterized membrane protein YdfJ with MMPL/SSD domain